MITASMARVVVINTTERGLQTIVRRILGQFDPMFDNRSNLAAAAVVIAGAELMVTTGLRDKASYLAICEAAFDHAMI